MTTSRARLHALVHGYVQGVGFRMFAAREARRLGLDGTVRNRADGAVEVIAEGERPVLEGFLRALQQGPGEAEVARVDVSWGPAQPAPAGFHIVV